MFVSVAKEVYPKLDAFKSANELAAAACPINSDPNIMKLLRSSDEDGSEDVFGENEQDDVSYKRDDDGI